MFMFISIAEVRNSNYLYSFRTKYCSHAYKLGYRAKGYYYKNAVRG